MTHATQPIFSIVPTFFGGNIIRLSAAAVTTTNYQVTNNTQITRQFTIKPMNGIRQLNTLNGCTSPFTLAPGESCQLTLLIDGSHIAAHGAIGGPEVCVTQGNNNNPDPFLCSRPSRNNLLTISIHSPRSYVTNLDETPEINSVTQCHLNLSTGIFDACSATSARRPDGTQIRTARGIAVNAPGNQVYILDSSNRNLYSCQINETNGDLTDCIDSDLSGFPSSYTSTHIAINPQNTLGYISFRRYRTADPSYVYKCPINPVTGVWGPACTLSATFSNDLEGFTLSLDGKHIYLVYEDTLASLTQCQLNADNNWDNCTTEPYASGGVIQSYGIALNTDQSKAYISALDGSYTAYMCMVNSSGVIDQACINMNTNLGDIHVRGIALTAGQTYGLIVGSVADKISSCPINSVTELFSEECSVTPTGSYLSDPYEIVLR
jgi:hypothetical protein